MNALRRTGLVALSLSALAATAAAQDKKCEINEGSPYQVNSAKIYLNKVQSGKESEREGHLKDAVAVLTTNPEKINNPVGRSWMLGRAYYEWTQRPVIGVNVVTRGQVGFTTDTDKPIDLVAAMDTALTVVESANPACASQTVPLRRNTFAKLFNPAIELLNAGQLDTAFALINRSLLIYRSSPYAYTALANIASQKGDVKGAVAAYAKAAELAGSDTTYSKVRHQAMYNSAILTLQNAETLSGDDKKAEIAKARALLEDYVKEMPNDANAKQALARAANALGDTTAVANVYADMIQNPSKFTDIQLFEAGSGAAAAGRNADAAQLIEAGLTQNPYYRDALYNLANVYFKANQPEKMLPIARRLTEVDPSNPDNWRLLAAVYQLENKATNDAKLKKAHTDSLIAFLTKSEKMPVRVNINSFQHAGAKHTLSGSIENLGATQASYALKVEFLDKAGAVIATQTQSVGPVAPKANQAFTVTVTQPGIVAFRYAPLP